MSNYKSVICIAALAEGCSIDELPLDNRSDSWWIKFWQVFGRREAERVANDFKRFKA